MCPITGMKHHSAWGESSPAGRLVAGSNGWWISRKQDDASGCRGSDCASSKGRCIALVTTMSGQDKPRNDKVSAPCASAGTWGREDRKDVRVGKRGSYHVGLGGGGKNK